MSLEDLTIRIGAELDYAAFNRAQKEAFTRFKQMSSAAAQAFQKMGGAFNAMGNDVVRAQTQGQQYWSNYMNSVKGAELVTKNFQTGFQKWLQTFDGAAMSLMFFGMVLQSVFQRIWRQGSKVFNDVMHSVDGVVTGFDYLTGATAHLGFMLGQALEPVAMWLAPIIDGIAEWASENQGLVRVIVMTIGVLGSFFFLLGFLTMVFKALIVKTIGFVKSIQLLWTVLHGQAIYAAIKAFFTGLVTKIALITAGVWKWVAAQVALIAPWLAIIGLIALAIALGISIAATWNQIIDGWKLKIGLFAVYFQGFVDKLWTGIQTFFLDIQWWALTIIKFVLDRFSGLVQNIINMLSGIIEAYNKIARGNPFLSTIANPFKNMKAGIDTSAIDTKLNEIASKRGVLTAEYQEREKDRDRLISEFAKAMSENEKTAKENFLDAWEQVGDMFKDALDGLNEKLGFDLSGVEDVTLQQNSNTGDVYSDSNVTNNLNITVEGSNLSIEEIIEQANLYANNQGNI